MATEFDGTFWPAKAVIKGVRTTSNPAARDPDLDITFYCRGYDRFGDPNQGVWFAEATLSGSKSGTMGTTNTITAEATISGTAVWGNVFSGVFTDCLATIEGSILLLGAKTNWAMWSKIGSADFTIDSSNEAGEMPLDMAGTIYCVRKHQGSVVAYGSNSIVLMTPREVFWGSSRLLQLGLINKGAVAVKEDIAHWFVDAKGVLWELSDKLYKLDYSHLFADLSDLILSYDNEYGFVYLCNGSKGYVYNPETRSMTEGPVGISGIHYSGGVSNVVAANDIEIPKFSMKTSVIDFGNRKKKTISAVEISTNLTVSIGVRIYWKTEFDREFHVTGWHLFAKDGIAYIPCYGTEFQIEIAAKNYEELKFVDYVKIHGTIHNFNSLDYQREL